MKIPTMTLLEWTFVLVCSGAVLLGGCSIDEYANPAYGCAKSCKECHKGFCYDADAGSTPTKDAGGDGGDDEDGGDDDGGIDDLAGKPCDNEEDVDPCYLGPLATKDKGACQTGERTCTDGEWTQCFGEVRPTPEVCNGEDDDCDGAEDEGDLMLGSCTSQDPLVSEAVGECKIGSLVCERGTAICVTNIPEAETCDGKDNDCDDKTDEGADVPCFEGSGCTLGDDGTYACQGICKAGMKRCIDGASAALCDDQVQARTETCVQANGVAINEDCDDKTDEGCTCSAGQVQNCYDGAELTRNVGECRAGTQTCSGGTFGGAACVGQTLPTAETCTNQTQDNDCDDVDDNVPMRGDACTVEENEGICQSGTLECMGESLLCMTPDPAEAETVCDGLDENCNGETDETFMLQTDEENCGECGMTCDNGRDCCSGACVDRDRDRNNCGQCGMACGIGFECCGGICRNINTNPNHCGMCGRVCILSLGGLMCRDGRCSTL